MREIVIHFNGDGLSIKTERVCIDEEQIRDYRWIEKHGTKQMADMWMMDKLKYCFKTTKQKQISGWEFLRGHLRTLPR